MALIIRVIQHNRVAQRFGRGFPWLVVLIVLGSLAGCSTFEEVDVGNAPPCDLRERPVNCQEMSLQGFDLSRSDLRGANFAGTDLAGATLFETDLTGADLTGADLTNTNLGQAFLARAVLDAVVWDNTRCPDGTLSDDNGGTCGGHLDDLRSRCDVRPNVDCSGQDLSNADLRYANLAGADLVGANVSGTDFTGANLTGSDFSLAVLTDVVWNSTTCPDGTLSDDHTSADDPTQGSCGGHLNPTPVEACVIGPGANCAGADLSGLDLRYANLEGADLSGANLLRTQLQHAWLQQANLTGVFADEADFSGANMIGALLLEARVPLALFNDVRWSGTTCPDGTNSDDNGDTCGGHWIPCPACDAKPGAQCARTTILRCDMRYANLEGANLADASVRSTFFEHANLRFATLNSIQFMDPIRFDHADLLDAQLSNTAILPNSNLAWNNTRCPDGTNSDDNGGTCGGHINTAVLSRGCDVKPGAICRELDLSGLNLERSNLSGAELIRSNFDGTRF
ncbi:MAG: pentapeptide repeat-containing protein, partial [Myxococcota bacterium]